MVKAVCIHEHGDASVMRFENVTIGAPGPGDVLLRQTAIGLNFIDIYNRSGTYPLESFPSILGYEGAGVVEAIGENVSEFELGDRVAYCSSSIGAYSEVRLISADELVKLPDTIDDEAAAAMMLQGLTAQYLIRTTYRVQPGDKVLFHAAAGGVGLIACQWLKHLGATIIGTVGSDEKAKLAKAHGCDHTILYRSENVVNRVHELTNTEGVSVVYDGVGKDTFYDSLDCLRPLGMLVSFGNASGPIESFDPAILAQKGSLFLTRPILFHYNSNRKDLLANAKELFEVVESGIVKIEINQRFPLAEAEKAHRQLEGRQTTGSTILLP